MASPTSSFVMLALLGSLLHGCAHQPAASPDYIIPTKGQPEFDAPSKQRAPHSGPRRYVLNEARRQLGSPYRYGGTTPRGFDCSGLIYYSYRQAGITVPRTARDQRNRATPVSPRAIRPGDLVFFRFAGRKTDHVGIYNGDGHFIHAPSSGKRVSLASLDNPYWRKHLVGAGHFF